MSKSKPFLEKNYTGVNMLLPIYLQMRDNMRLPVEYDQMTATINTRYGRVDLDVLAAVIDQVFAEIDEDSAILLSNSPDHRLHFAMSVMIREEPRQVDPFFWQFALTQRIIQYLTLNN